MSIPEKVDALVKELARDGESYSAAMARLVEAGARRLKAGKAPLYVGSGEGPGDLSERAEEVLREVLAKWRD